MKQLLWNLKLLINILSPNALSRLNFFVTQKCNASCSFCFNKENGHDKKIEDLSLAEIEMMSTHLGFLPFLTITGGEPFLRKDLNDICSLFYIKCRTRFITIVTNGILTADIITCVETLLLDHQKLTLTVIVALDDVEQYHDAIKATPGCYKNAANTLSALSSLKETFPNLIIAINTMLIKDNASRIKEILMHFSTAFSYDRISLNLPRTSPNTSIEPQYITMNLYFDLMEKSNYSSLQRLSPMKRFFALRFIMAIRKKINREFIAKRALSPCIAAKKFLIISSDGEIYPCELLLSSLGNVRKANYDVRCLLRDKKALAIKKSIKDTHCYCQWSCAVVNNILFKARSYVEMLFKSP